MSEGRLADYLDHMRRAGRDARVFVEGLSKEDFLADKRTQQAVIMSLVIIGEAATKIMDQYGEFAARHPEVPWRSMCGMRNRIAHGDAFVRQRPRDIEAERFQIARQNFHGGDAARLDGGDKIGAVREGKIRAAPKAETLCIGEIMHAGSTRGRDIDDARLRQRVLKPQACAALLRRRLAVTDYEKERSVVLGRLDTLEDKLNAVIEANPQIKVIPKRRKKKPHEAS
jgi:uncharacterized protein with HEPN domain